MLPVMMISTDSFLANVCGAGTMPQDSGTIHLYSKEVSRAQNNVVAVTLFFWKLNHKQL